MIFDNLNEICIEGDDITQFIDQNIIECFCVYMVVKVDDPVSELAYFDVGLGLIFWEKTTLIQYLDDFCIRIGCLEAKGGDNIAAYVKKCLYRSLKSV